jgi:hypothetical protein
MKQISYILALLLLCASCNDNNNDNSNKQAPAEQTISLERPNPGLKAVATFSEDVTTETGKLNNWKFAVTLYETHQTFTYRIQIQYDELNVTDSLQFPNLGFIPRPALQKGKDEYSCVIGFLDDKNIFRDYKLVSVTNGNVHFHTLKYYSVQ